MTDWENAYKELVEHTASVIGETMPGSKQVFLLMTDMIVLKWTVRDVETKPEPKN